MCLKIAYTYHTIYIYIYILYIIQCIIYIGIIRKHRKGSSFGGDVLYRRHHNYNTRIINRVLLYRFLASLMEFDSYKLKPRIALKSDSIVCEPNDSYYYFSFCITIYIQYTYMYYIIGDHFSIVTYYYNTTNIVPCRHLMSHIYIITLHCCSR